MTQVEINELIKYLEKHYHVSCTYIPHDQYQDGSGERAKLIISPTFTYHFSGKSLSKDFITNHLNKLDLIRF